MAEPFHYRVAWSPEDGEYVGTCAEFPSLSHLAADQDAALRGIRELVAAEVRLQTPAEKLARAQKIMLTSSKIEERRSSKERRAYGKRVFQKYRG
jgi:hypothetical protein